MAERVPSIPGMDVSGELGRGPGGIDYRAMCVDRSCVVRLAPDVTGPQRDQVFRAFRTQAIALARARHPAIPAVLEMGVFEERPYAVMELPEGETLAERLRWGTLGEAEIVTLAVSLLGALLDVHRRGLVHGHLTAAHVVFVNGGEDVRVVEFGAAPDTRESPHVPDFRTDLSALGRMLYEAATGRVAFAGLTDDPRGALTELPELSSGNDPLTTADLSRLIARLVRFDSDPRPTDPELLLRDLIRLESGAPVLDAPSTTRGPRDIAAPDEVPLVGRKGALEALSDAWTDARAGIGAIAHVRGPAGSGKTRLVRAFLRDACPEPRLVLAVRCASGDTRPFAGLRELLDERTRTEHAHAANGAGLRGALREAGEEMASLVKGLSPELSGLFAGVADLGAPYEAQALIAETAAEFLTRLLTSSGPAIVWIDDVQWMDASSRAVLTRVADRARGSRILFVVTSRTEEHGTPEVDAFFRPIRNLRTVDCPLGPLEPDECRRLVEAYLGAPGLQHDVTAPLITLGDGTPMSLLEVLNAIVGDGLLVPFWGQWRLDLERFERMQFPTRTREILARRLADLSPNARRVMSVAALLGLGVDETFLARATDGADVAGALREARDARVLVRTGSNESRFVHDTVREALVGQMGDGEIRATQQRIAERLDADGASDLPSVCRLATAYGAGDWQRAPERVFVTNYEAGRRTFASFDNDRALSFLTVAERVAVAGGIDPDSEFYQTLGELYLRRGALGKSLECFQLALARTKTPLTLGILQSRIAWVEYTMGETARAWRALEVAFAALSEGMPTGTPLSLARAVLSSRTVRRELRLGWPVASMKEADRQRLDALWTLHYQAARLALECGQPGRFLAHVLKGTEQAERLGPSRALVRALLAYGFTQVTLGRKSGGLAWLEQAEAMAEAIRDPVVSAYCLQMRSVIMGWAGDIDAALQAGSQLLSERGHWLELSEYCLLCTSQSLMLGMRGQAQAAWEWIARGVDKVRHELYPTEITSFLEQTARAALLTLGREAELSRHLDPVRLPSSEASGGREPYHRFAVGARVRAFTEVGNLGAEFEAFVRKVRSTSLDPSRAHLALAEFYAHVAHARVHQCLRAREDERQQWLAELATSVRELRAIARIPVLTAHCWVLEGYQALFEGSFLRASLLFSLADDLAQRQDCPWVLHAVARGRAHMHALEGRREPAHAQATIAETIAQTHGYAYRLQWIREEFPALSIAGSPVVVDGDSVTAGRQLDSLLHIAQASPSDLNLTEQVEHIIDELVECLGAHGGTLYLSPETGGSPVQIARRDRARLDGEIPTAALETVVRRAFQSGRTIIERHHFLVGRDGPRGRSLIASPLLLRHRLIGVVCLETNRPVSSEGVRVLEVLANQAAVTLELTRVLRAYAEELRERKILEDGLRQAQKMEAIGRLSGAIAHDFNNILAIITATLDYGQRQASGLAGRELADIREACERGTALTRQLLTFSRRQPQASKVVGLNGVVSSALPLMRRLLTDRIEVVTRFESEQDTVLADPVRLEQVLLNLAANARDAMPHGGRLTFATRDIQDSPGNVELCVQDTGQGMAPEVLRQAFEPFFTTKAQGTGLGLATVYGIVRQMGGEIAVESAPGEGTVFRMVFPSAAQSAERDDPTPSSQRRQARRLDSLQSKPARRPATILLVDDERLVLTALERGLIGEGYRVIAAMTGEEAIELVKTRGFRIDAIVTDVLMPGMTGPQLIAELEAEGIEPPHLFMSGFTGSEPLPGRGLDQERLLVKPFTIDTLVERIQQLLREQPRSTEQSG